MSDDAGPNAADAPPPDFRLPRSTFLWLAVLIVAVLAPYALGPRTGRPERVRPNREAALSTVDFERYVTAEQQTRNAFAIDTLMRRATAGAFAADRAAGSPDLRKQRDRAFREAADAYRRLLREQPESPNLVRRVLVVEHAAGRPLDTLLIAPKGPLLRALAAQKAAPGDADDEVGLWNAMYGAAPGVTPPDPEQGAKLLRAMNLRFVQDRALSDLYAAAGDKKQADALQKAFDYRALTHWTRTLALNAVLGISFLAGLAFAVIALRFAVVRRWGDIRTSEPAPARIGYGDLMDVAVFYLAVVQVWRLASGYLLPLALQSPSVTQVVGAAGVVYVGSALVATAYLMLRLRARGATLADIGLRSPGFWLYEVAYGAAGYCAMLPLVLCLGMLARFLFRHNTNLTPNPILPLLVSERDLVGRIFIFLLVAVAAPLFEELFFRGVLYTGLRRRYGWVLSGFLSALVFAILHPMSDWLPILGMGFAFAALRESRQGLIPSMTAHFLQNGFSFLSLSLLFSS